MPETIKFKDREFESGDSDDIRLKKYEQLFSIVSASFDYEISRYERVEAKTARILAGLNLFLGFLVLGSKEALSVLKQDQSLLASAFALAYGVVLVLALSSILCLLTSLRFHQLSRLSVDEELIRTFDVNRYVDVIYTISKHSIEHLQQNREETRKKIGWITRGFALARWVLWMIPVVVVLYAILTLSK